MYIWYKFNRSWNYWKTSKLVLTAKVITESLVISSSSNADFSSYFNSGHCGLCCTKLPWQPFSCHSEIKPVLCGSKKASFPCPIINWDQLLLKGYDKWQKSFFSDQYVGQLGLLFCRCYTECFQNVLPAGRHFVLVNLASFWTLPCIFFHSPKKGRILGPPSLQLYCSKRIRGGGEGECLWGILVFTFNLELRAVAWETKPKKKNLIFACTFKSSNGRMCFCVERKSSKFKGPIRRGLLSAQLTSQYHRYFLSHC